MEIKIHYGMMTESKKSGKKCEKNTLKVHENENTKQENLWNTESNSNKENLYL